MQVYLHNDCRLDHSIDRIHKCALFDDKIPCTNPSNNHTDIQHNYLHNDFDTNHSVFLLDSFAAKLDGNYLCSSHNNNRNRKCKEFLRKYCNKNPNGS